MLVTEFVPGDRILFSDEKKSLKVILPNAEIITPKYPNGKPVRDSLGKIVTIRKERPWLESCTDSAMIHLHTDRGVICVHREATAELVSW